MDHEDIAFTLDVDAYTLQTPDCVIDLRRVCSFSDNPLRYCIEEIDTPVLRGYYWVKEGDTLALIDRATDYLDWIRMIISAIQAG